MCSITWWHFQWPRRPLTRFSRSRHFWSRISQKRCILGTKLLKNTNRKPYTIYRMIPLLMTLSDLWPHFKVTTFFEVKYRKNLKTKLLLHNRKLYLTHGMVLCLVTLTDLQTRRAGLSASAELLVGTLSSWRQREREPITVVWGQSLRTPLGALLQDPQIPASGQGMGK